MTRNKIFFLLSVLMTLVSRYFVGTIFMGVFFVIIFAMGVKLNLWLSTDQTRQALHYSILGGSAFLALIQTFQVAPVYKQLFLKDQK